MKKFITRSLFAFVIMGFALVSVNAAVTVYNPSDWTAGNGYGTATEVESYITNIKGEYNDAAGMYYGPYSKKSTTLALEDGIVEETHIDLDFQTIGVGEYFEVTVSLDDEDENYLDEAVVMTQLVEEGKFKLTAGWATDFEAVVTKDGVYTYQWKVYKENQKAYVEFSLLKNGEVVETTGAVEFAKLNVEGVTVRSFWFCNVNVQDGINVYSKLPTLTVETDTESDFLTVVDPEEAAGILEKGAREDETLGYYVERFDSVVVVVPAELNDEDLENMTDEEEAMFDDAVKNDKIFKYFTNMIGVGDEHGVDILMDYKEDIEYNLVLPENLPAVAKGFERKYYVIEAYPTDMQEEEYEVSAIEATLSKDGKSLTFATSKSAIYALSYVDTELPPQTGDNIIIYVIIGIVSILGLAVVGLKSKKMFN